MNALEQLGLYTLRDRLLAIDENGRFTVEPLRQAGLL
jgi:hypothetical protein